MKLKSVTSKDFIPYGTVLEGIATDKIVKALEKYAEKPEDRSLYVPSDENLEALPAFKEFRDKIFGGIPIQFGYCSGYNTKLNCLEYHRGCEVVIPADDIILLFAKLQDIKNASINTSKVEAFSVPRGMAVLYYETTLHYSPAKKGGSYRALIVLPKGTNTDKPKLSKPSGDDLMLLARNKWLIAHPDSPEAKQKGVVVGLKGKNIDVEKDLD